MRNKTFLGLLVSEDAELQLWIRPLCGIPYSWSYKELSVANVCQGLILR